MVIHAKLNVVHTNCFSLHCNKPVNLAMSRLRNVEFGDVHVTTISTNLARQDVCVRARAREEFKIISMTMEELTCYLK